MESLLNLYDNVFIVRILHFGGNNFKQTLHETCYLIYCVNWQGSRYKKLHDTSIAILALPCNRAFTSHYTCIFLYLKYCLLHKSLNFWLCWQNTWNRNLFFHIYDYENLDNETLYKEIISVIFSIGIIYMINHFTDTNVRASLWSYGNQNYIYLYNQCLSPTSFVIYFPLMARPTCNRCNHQDITDILFKVVLKHPKPNPVIMPCEWFTKNLLRFWGTSESN
jgi:hypothetical protein